MSKRPDTRRVAMMRHKSLVLVVGLALLLFGAALAAGWLSSPGQDRVMAASSDGEEPSDAWAAPLRMAGGVIAIAGVALVVISLLPREDAS